MEENTQAETHMDNKKEINFFPFHAINEFMTDEYKEKVIRQVLDSLDELPDYYRSPIDQLIKKTVKVPGFRNSVKAPTAMKLKPTILTFQKNPALVAAMLRAWAELHATLRQQVYEMLISRNWELMPLDADRTRLPGFLTKWPLGEDFEVLYDAFTQLQPENSLEQNDVSLMVVWLVGRLPYEFVEITKDDASLESDIEPSNESSSGME